MKSKIASVAALFAFLFLGSCEFAKAELDEPGDPVHPKSFSVHRAEPAEVEDLCEPGRLTDVPTMGRIHQVPCVVVDHGHSDGGSRPRVECSGKVLTEDTNSRQRLGEAVGEFRPHVSSNRREGLGFPQLFQPAAVFLLLGSSPKSRGTWD